MIALYYKRENSYNAHFITFRLGLITSDRVLSQQMGSIDVH